jgi:enamine deaminase RidA (YjgF/YER057c/UK114 family)
MNDDEVRAGLAETPGYRYAEVVGSQLFVAGQVPLDASGELTGIGEASIQATTCLENLRVVLGVHGFDVADIRHLVVSVVGDQQNLHDAWAAVRTWFDDVVPPATLLGVNLLGYAGQLVEIDATIVKRHSDTTAPH